MQVAAYTGTVGGPVRRPPSAADRHVTDAVATGFSIDVLMA